MSSADSARLLDTLDHDDDPGRAIPEVPWAAVLLRSDGSLVATSSTMLPSGLFYRAEGSGHDLRIAIGTDPGAVVSAWGTSDLDADYLRRVAIMRTPPDRTPFLKIRRTVPGRTYSWRPEQVNARPKTVTWCGPELWNDPDAEGPGIAEEYLASFDRVLAGLLIGRRVLACSLSSGLDSTFLAASMAMATTGSRPVLGLVHAPLQQANVGAVDGSDPDESKLARAIESSYGSRILVRSIVNEPLVQPLDAAEAASRRSWIPSLNPHNQVWMNRIQDLAAEAGADSLFVGSHGNASFSDAHLYALHYYLGTSRWWYAWRLAPLCDPNRVPWRARTHILVAPLVHRLRRRQSAVTSYTRLLGLEALASEVAPPDNRSGRESFLKFLSGQEYGFAAAANPAGPPVQLLDPFRARSIIELAARITPAEWHSNPHEVGGFRGYARRLARGRVPDPIRLSAVAGSQGRDTWYVIRNQRTRYLDEIASLRNSPALGPVINHGHLNRIATAWPWGEPAGPPHPEVVGVTRILALAGFERRMTATLRGIASAGTGV